jgi:hypothetical protein
MMTCDGNDDFLIIPGGQAKNKTAQPMKARLG